MAGISSELLREAFEVLFARACAEDFGENGDITSEAIFSGETDEAVIISRQEVCISGLSWAREVFGRIDATLLVTSDFKDGDVVPPDTVVIRISGSVASMLKAERTALNFLGYLSGIATQTRQLSQLMKGLGATVILDTRKTLPGYRLLAKAAVLHGGGTNHRLGLHDMVMIKDNHIDAAGGITPAVQKIRSRWGNRFPIEVECRSLADVREALVLEPEVIMLDNMDASACADAIALRQLEFPASKSKFEASGDMDREKIMVFAGLGLDYISVGRLTHSVTNANFSMRILRRKV